MFEEIKERVDIEQAARFYGIEFARGHMAHCPFHQDRTPSMSFRNGRFKCFSCGESGDVIDLTAALSGLSIGDAAKRLNDDFGLGLDWSRRPTLEEKSKAQAERERRQAFDLWWRGAYNILARYRRYLAHCKERAAPDGPEKAAAKEFYTALKELDIIDYLLDLLSYGSVSDRLFVYQNYRNEVVELAKKFGYRNIGGAAG